jgi:hypothetical protein
MGLIEMTQPYPPVGWYPDPTGRHESRYFNGQWSQYVSTRGVNSVDPLTASPFPAAGAPVNTLVSAPYLPAAPGGPMMSPYLPSGPTTNQRSPKVKLAIAGGVVVVAVGIALAVSLSGGSNGGHGFCADAIALNREYPSATSIKNASQIPHAASEFDTLATESPSSEDAADLRLMARWLRNVINGDDAAVNDQAQAEAAATRFDAYATKQCSSNGTGG